MNTPEIIFKKEMVEAIESIIEPVINKIERDNCVKIIYKDRHFTIAIREDFPN